MAQRLPIVEGVGRAGADSRLDDVASPRRRPQDPAEARSLGPLEVPDPGLDPVRLLLVAEAERQPHQVGGRRFLGDRREAVLGLGAARARGAAPVALRGGRALVGLLPVLEVQGLRAGRAPPVPHGPVGAVPDRTGAPDPVLAAAVRGDHRPVHRSEPGGGPHRPARPVPLLASVGRPADHLPAAADQPVRPVVLVPVPGRRRDLLPRRHRHPLRGRVGPGPGEGTGAGEPDLPGEPRGHRGGGGLRPRRHPAVRPARHGQDPAGRSRRGRDRQALRVRRPRRLHQHVHGRGHPQGEEPVPQAPQAGPALRGRGGLLRRGRRARQPGRVGGRRRRLRLGAVRGVPARRHGGRLVVPVPVTRRAAGASGGRAGRVRSSRRPGRLRGRRQLGRPPAGVDHDDGRRRWRHGHPSGSAGRVVGPQEAPRILQPDHSQDAGDAAQAAPEVPDPGDDGLQPARGPRSGHAAAGPHRPDLQGRLPHH